MAEIKQITLPTGDTYDLKDASAVSSVTQSGHTVTVAKRNGTSSSFSIFDDAVIADVFSTSSTYAKGDYCMYNGGLYRCIEAVTTAGEWDSTCWLSTTVMAEVMYLFTSKYLVTDTNEYFINDDNAYVIES